MGDAGLHIDDVRRFLEDHHGRDVQRLEPLGGGHWSAAYGYAVDDRELVVRFGAMREGYEMDRAAAALASPDLPVPEVLHIGEAFGRYFAISVRHHGRFLEDVVPEEADAVGPAIVRLLEAMRRVPAPPGASSTFTGSSEPTGQTWRERILSGLVDDPAHAVNGWRPKIAARPDLDAVFRAAEHEIGRLLPACPERRDVVHADLLHQNVLVSDDATRVNAVFSWKCAARGDFLYDVAWCEFWGAVAHPGIRAANVADRVLSSFPAGAREAVDADARLRCYELQIGASHLGWYAWTEDDDGLRSVASRLTDLLTEKPLG